MIAEEIRKVTIGQSEANRAQFVCAMLQEIAAQLCELKDVLWEMWQEQQNHNRRG